MQAWTGFAKIRKRDDRKSQSRLVLSDARDLSDHRSPCCGGRVTHDFPWLLMKLKVFMEVQVKCRSAGVQVSAFNVGPSRVAWQFPTMHTERKYFYAKTRTQASA